MTEGIVKEKLKLTQELERSKYFQLDLWPVEFVGNTLNLLRSCRLGSFFAGCWEALTMDKMMALGMGFLSEAWKGEILPWEVD